MEADLDTVAVCRLCRKHPAIKTEIPKLGKYALHIYLLLVAALI
jgi:hypothetical protein